MTNTARRWSIWLMCGGLILALGGFSMAGLGTRDATADVTGIWDMTLSGMGFNTDSDMPTSYYRAELLTLFQHGSFIHGYAGSPFSKGIPNGYHTIYFEGFVAGNRIWLFSGNDRKTPYPGPMPLFLSIVGRVEADETIVAEFILLEFDYGIPGKQAPTEGQGASGLFRAVKVEDIIIEPLR